MGRDRRNEKRVKQFTFWEVSERQLPAWKALRWPARTVYFHLRRRCFAETAQKRPEVRNNNGAVFASPRTLAEETGGDRKTMMAALADLQAKGWIVCTKPWERGYDGHGRTALFRLTMLGTVPHKPFTPATRDPERWSEGNDFPVLVYESYTPGRPKTQNPPPRAGPLVDQQPVHCDEIRESSRPPNGPCKGQIEQSSGPSTGPYLIAMSTGSGDTLSPEPMSPAENRQPKCHQTKNQPTTEKEAS